jgi:hypothetical protein
MIRHEITFIELSKDKIQPAIAAEGDDMDCDIFPDQNISSSGSDLIDMVFRKTRVEDRKKWLNALQKDTFLDYSLAQTKGVKYSEFVNQELILFSKSDCERSIPHVMDGFKPSQRKVLFACFKRKLKEEIKVAQLAGYIGEHSAYHHGEASLHGTIINMAQSFCGSNNVNLLSPNGQFGTRYVSFHFCACLISNRSPSQRPCLIALQTNGREGCSVTSLHLHKAGKYNASHFPS